MNDFRYANIVFVILGAVIVLALGSILILPISGAIIDATSMESQSCHTIEISDKFTSVSGGGFSSSTHYYLTSNGTTYDFWIYYPDEIQRFRNINSSVEVKTYKNYAAFCDYTAMRR